jgi:hypothetical protein
MEVVVVEQYVTKLLVLLVQVVEEQVETITPTLLALLQLVLVEAVALELMLTADLHIIIQEQALRVE